MPYVVKLVKEPETYWREGYFPRKFHYREDAEKLKAEVSKRGGEAVVEKVVEADKKEEGHETE